MISKNTRPTVISYIRFSTPEQAMGDSERRQIEMAEAFAKKHGLQLDQRLTDRGLSGYSGANQKHGQLGNFLTAIELGIVAEGSFFVVENIDRLSRQEFVDAYDIVASIIKKGVSIVTLSPNEQIYDRDALNGPYIWELIVSIKRAHQESQTKSERLSKVWDKKKRNARTNLKPYAGNYPLWLRLLPDGEGGTKFEAIPEAVETYRRIFEMKAEGRSMLTLEKELNSGDYWEIPKHRRMATTGWRLSYIHKILRNRAVIGEHQPMKVDRNKVRTPDGDPILLYPPIIDPKLFYRVQKLLDKAASRPGNCGGRNGRFHNITRNLAVCAYCGFPMHYGDKGASKKGAFTYLICDGSKRSVGTSCCRDRIRTMNYPEIESLILENIPKIRSEQVLPAKNVADKETKRLTALLKGLQGEREAWQKERANLMQRIRKTSSEKLQSEYETTVLQLDQQISESEQNESKLRTELAIAEKDGQSVEKWKQDINQLVEFVRDAERSDIREKLNFHLQEFIVKIEVFSEGYQTVEPPEYLIKGLARDGKKVPRHLLPPPRHDDYLAGMIDVITDANPELLKDKEYMAFLDHLQEKRMTRAGRFIRVWFKSGATIDLVPPKSFASGYRYGRLPENQHDEENKGMGYVLVGPDLDDRWRKYKKHKPK